MKPFPFLRQLEGADCGPTCLRMVCRHYGREYSRAALRERIHLDRQGTSMLDLCDAAEAIGLRVTAADAPYEALVNERPFPAIVHWRQNHFVVLYHIDRRERAYIADPAFGLVRLDRADFLANCAGSDTGEEREASILFFDATPEFYASDVEAPAAHRRGLKELVCYLRPYRGYVVQLLLGMAAGSVMALLLAFLNQALIDVGIQGHNVGFITLVLIAQLVLFLGMATGDFIKSWITLHLGTRVNIAMMSDFLAKLTRLPMGFFDGKQTGDIMQRMTDLGRVQSFVTSTLPSMLFMAVTLIVYSALLLAYNARIFAIFAVGSAAYIAWILTFLRRRRDLDYRKFDVSAGNQSALIAFIQGMQEVKLHHAERQKRWEWERIQASLFKVSVSALSVEQYQTLGSGVIHKLKNILVTFVAAQAVVSGSITLGMMVTIQYILGALDGPVTSLAGFIRSFQDANIGIERVQEVYARDDEERGSEERLVELPADRTIRLAKVSFRYGGPRAPLVLQNVDLSIPHGSVTAIVGASGSGKTTLLKLLLQYYPVSDGSITVGPHELGAYRAGFWRERCGAVMQDGFIFSDTIANNIAIGEETIDRERLLHAARVANVQGFIETLPAGYATRIGREGVALSGGQRQRVLIARAVYKEPEFVFFDEATSSLDAHNERLIMDNLADFFRGRTAVVIAHRLSTVKHADQIVVLREGELVEQGDHDSLTTARGAYFSLIRNQLEMGG